VSRLYGGIHFRSDNEAGSCWAGRSDGLPRSDMTSAASP
jgi:hypothetical protein